MGRKSREFPKQLMFGSGGRAGTRTPDLQRVKKENSFHLFYVFHTFFLRFNKLGHLLRAESLSLLFAADGVLIRF